MSDTYCIICSMPSTAPRSYKLDESYFKNNGWDISKIKLKEKELREKCKYFDKITILTYDSHVIHNRMAEGAFGKFNGTSMAYSLKNDFYTENITDYAYNINTWVHTACWNFIKKEYNIELTAAHLPLVELKDLKNKKPFIQYYCARLLTHIDYGEVIKYCSQYFDYDKIIFDKNEWMCFGFDNEKNIKRIIKIINQFKIKINRPSPNVSASFYKDGLIKIGNNNKFWIIKNNKWTQIPDNISKYKYGIKFPDITNGNFIRKNKIMKILNSIPQTALYNSEPIFLADITLTKKNINYICTFSLYFIDDMANKIIKILEPYRII